MKIEIIGIAGIIGGGWTFDEEPNTFYVYLMSFKGDLQGFSYLAAHEIYHLLQYRFMKETSKRDKNKVEYILDQLIREGSAIYIADFSKLKANGWYVDFNKTEYERNFRRMKSNFFLFEMILQQANNKDSIPIDELYTIGYSGMYQSPLYYVGYYMMKLIEEFYGQKELIRLLKEHPSYLILKYNQLIDIQNSAGEDYIAISKPTLKIIESFGK